MEFDARLRSDASARAAEKRADAAELRRQAAQLEAAAAIIERTWKLPASTLDDASGQK